MRLSRTINTAADRYRLRGAGLSYTLRPLDNAPAIPANAVVDNAIVVTDNAVTVVNT